jgi:hypothetical protein
MRRLSLIAAAGLLGALLITGCAGKERKVTGSVTWKGAPLAEGTINLIATDPTVPAVSGKIVHGEFEVYALPGSKQVEIWASREVGEYLPEMGMKAREMYIPEIYNARTRLTMEVSPSGENRFTFDLPEKAGE